VLFVQVRADLRSVCLEALTEKTADGRRALQLRKEADRLMERFNQVCCPPLAIQRQDNGEAVVVPRG